MSNILEKNSTFKKLVVFELQKEKLALDILFVREILKKEILHEVPQSPEFLEGIVELRGHFVAVLNLRKKFGLPHKELRDKENIVICKMGNIVAGLLVDSVLDIITVNKTDIKPMPNIYFIHSEDSCLLGVTELEKSVISILDPKKLLHEKELLKLSIFSKNKS